MLEILLLVGVGFWFSKMAQSHNIEKPWIWVVAGIGGYLGGLILTAVIVALVSPRTLNDLLTLMGIMFVGGIAGVFITRFLLISNAKKNPRNNPSDILDNQEDPIFDDLLD